MAVTSEEFERLLALRFEREGGDIDTAANSVIMGLMVGAWRMEAALDTAVHRPLDMTWAGFRLLFCLWVCGPMKTGELAPVLFITAPTVSSVVNTLERRGYVERRRGSADRRQVSICLTRRGERLIARAFRMQHVFEKAWVAGLSKSDIATFLRVLGHLAEHVQASQREAAPA